MLLVACSWESLGELLKAAMQVGNIQLGLPVNATEAALLLVMFSWESP